MPTSKIIQFGFILLAIMKVSRVMGDTFPSVSPQRPSTTILKGKYTTITTPLIKPPATKLLKDNYNAGSIGLINNNYKTDDMKLVGYVITNKTDAFVKLTPPTIMDMSSLPQTSYLPTTGKIQLLCVEGFVLYFML